MTTQEKLILFFQGRTEPAPTFNILSPGLAGWFRRMTRDLLTAVYGDAEHTHQPEPIWFRKPKPFRWLHRKAKAAIVLDVVEITILSMYPTLTVQLFQENKLKANHPDLLPLFQAMVEGRKIAKNVLSVEQAHTWKAYLNMFWGCVQNRYAYYQVEGMSQVVERGYQIWESITGLFPDIFASVDTDTAYFRSTPYVLGVITTTLESHGLICCADVYDQVLFIECGKLVLWKDGRVSYSRIHEWK